MTRHRQTQLPRTLSGVALLLGMGCSYDWDTLDPRLAEDGSGGEGPGGGTAAAGRTGAIGGASAGQSAVAGAPSGVGGAGAVAGSSQAGGADAGGAGGDGGGGTGHTGTAGESAAGTAGRGGEGGANQGGWSAVLGGAGTGQAGWSVGDAGTGQGGQVVSVGGSAGEGGTSGAIGTGGIAGSGGAGGAEAGGAGAPSAGGVAGAGATGGVAGAPMTGGTAGAAAGAGGEAGACAGTLCGTECVDLTADTSHCGECGRGCSSFHVDTQICTAGVCDSVCRAGWGNCTQPAAPANDDGCETAIDTDTDCGSCGNVCTGRETCRAGLCAPCAAWGLGALFVVDDAGLNTGDAEAQRWLEQGLGFTVTVMDEVTVQSSDATGMELVVVSSTVDSINVTTKFTDTTAPVVTWESYIFDDLKLTGPTGGTDYGVTADQTTLDIVDTAHPAAGGLTGTVTVFVGTRNMRWGVPAAGRVVIASLTGATQQETVFTFDTGAELIDATAAPARRVGLFMDNFGPVSVTPDGIRLALTSICWAVGM